MGTFLVCFAIYMHVRVLTPVDYYTILHLIAWYD